MDISKIIVNVLEDLLIRDIINSYAPGYPADFSSVPVVSYRITDRTDAKIANRDRLISVTVHFDIWAKTIDETHNIYDLLNCAVMDLGFSRELNEDMAQKDEKYKHKVLRYSAKIDIITGFAYKK